MSVTLNQGLKGYQESITNEKGAILSFEYLAKKKELLVDEQKKLILKVSKQGRLTCIDSLVVC